MATLRDRFLNRDCFSQWQRAKSALSLANADISGMTGTLAGFITMIKAKSAHITNRQFRDTDFPTTLTNWGASIDQASGAGATDALMSTAQGTGTLAAISSMFTGLGDTTLVDNTQAATLTTIFP